MSKRIAPLVGFLVALALGLAYVRLSAGRVSYRPVQQPLPFNHYVHTHHPEQPVECVGCHRGVETTYNAMLPTIAVCSSCHLEPKGDTEEEERFIEEYVDAEKPVSWKRLFALPSHSFFSHRLHVIRAEVECQICHGLMELQARPPSRPLSVMTMENCMDCHEERQVTNDCNTCHR